MREQPSVLRHVSDATPKRDGIHRRDVLAIRSHRSGIGRDEAIEATKQRRLTRSALADQRDARALGGGQGHIVERHDSAEALRDAFGDERFALTLRSGHRLNFDGLVRSGKSWPPR
jgi:hypothetical protein